jgi:hypothetical protein
VCNRYQVCPDRDLTECEELRNVPAWMVEQEQEEGGLATRPGDGIHDPCIRPTGVSEKYNRISSLFHGAASGPLARIGIAWGPSAQALGPPCGLSGRWGSSRNPRSCDEMPHTPQTFVALTPLDSTRLKNHRLSPTSAFK